MSDAKAIAEIRAADDKRKAAMMALDVDALDAILDDGLIYMHSSGVMDDKRAYLDGVRSKLWEYKSVHTEDERFTVRGDTATIFCHLMISLLVKGEPRTVDSNALAVWTKASGSWKLLSVLSSARPK
jgi:ketosteroid isomerase-like protein